MKSILLSILLYLISVQIGYTQYRKLSFYADKMGSPFKLTIGVDDKGIDSNKAAQLFSESIDLVDSLNHILSDYDSTSEISLINQNAGIRSSQMSPTIEEILKTGLIAYQETNKKYNIAIGALSHLWRKARKTKTFPSTNEVQYALDLIDFQKVWMDTIRHQVMILEKGILLDFGSLGKGYIAQKVMDFLHSKGVQYALVDAGGKIVTCAPDNLYWQIGINQIRNNKIVLPHTLHLQNHAVATSGDAYQFFVHQGKRYSHIIDPTKGYGIQTPKNVTVIAKEGLLADWLSTACSILPIKEAIRLAEKHHAEILIVTMQARNKKMRETFYQSKGIDRYLH